MEKRKTGWMVITGMGLIMVAIIFLMSFAMRGETTVRGTYPGSVREVSLVCERTSVNYPLFTFDNASGYRTDIKILFDDDGMRSISLIHALLYNDLETSKISEAHNHAAMNEAFGRDGLSADEFSAVYSTRQDKMVMTLYAGKKDFSPVAAAYFLAAGLSTDSSMKDFSDLYLQSGFHCVTNE